MQRCVKANNALPKGSPCHVLDLDEMIMKSLCRETCKNIMRMGTHKIIGQIRNFDYRPC